MGQFKTVKKNENFKNGVACAMMQMNLQIITLSILIIPLTKKFRKKIHLQTQANLISSDLGQQGLPANG